MSLVQNANLLLLMVKETVLVSPGSKEILEKSFSSFTGLVALLTF
jgi:hypothetical protein